MESIFTYVETFSIVAGLITALFGYKRWLKSLSLKRADYVNELTNRIRTNELITDALYLIDYSSEWYTEDFHTSGLDENIKNSVEKKIDYTLSYFSYICYLFEKKIIAREDFIFFKYYVHRICSNDQVKNYLYNIYHFSMYCDVPCSFHYLIEYARNNGFIADDFFDKESYKTGKYPKRLVF